MIFPALECCRYISKKKQNQTNNNNKKKFYILLSHIAEHLLADAFYNFGHEWTSFVVIFKDEFPISVLEIKVNI